MSRLIVKNLKKKVNDQLLEQSFSRIGRVSEAFVVRDKGGNSRGFGFVGFYKNEDAEKALVELNNSYILTGKIIIEKITKTRNNNLSEKDHSTTKTNKNYLDSISSLVNNSKNKTELKEIETVPKSNSLENKNYFDEVEGKTIISFNRDLADITSSIILHNIPPNTTSEEIGETVNLIVPGVETVQLTRCDSKGFRRSAFITYISPETAKTAVSLLNNTIILGREITAKPANHFKKTEKQNEVYKKKATQNEEVSWNLLYININTALSKASDEQGIQKSKLLNIGSEEVGVKMALIEASALQKTREWIEEQNIADDSYFVVSAPRKSKANTAVFQFNKKSSKEAEAIRSDTAFIIKHLPICTSQELEDFIRQRSGLKVHETLPRFSISPNGVLAIVEFATPGQAQYAENRLTFANFKGTPLLIERAPIALFKKACKAPEIKIKSARELANEWQNKIDNINENIDSTNLKITNDSAVDSSRNQSSKKFDKSDSKTKKLDNKSKEVSTPILYEKYNMDQNLTESQKIIHDEFSRDIIVNKPNIDTMKLISNTEDHILNSEISLDNVDHKIEPLKRARSETKSKRPKLNNTSELLEDNIEKMNHQINSDVNDTISALQIEIDSDTEVQPGKICVRNVPFQAKSSDILSLFSSIGTVADVRFPKKPGGREHRGFAFVTYTSSKHADLALEKLRGVHLFQRRLVLEHAK